MSSSLCPTKESRKASSNLIFRRFAWVSFSWCSRSSSSRFFRSSSSHFSRMRKTPFGGGRRYPSSSNLTSSQVPYGCWAEGKSRVLTGIREIVELWVGDNYTRIQFWKWVFSMIFEIFGVTWSNSNLYVKCFILKLILTNTSQFSPFYTLILPISFRNRFTCETSTKKCMNICNFSTYKLCRASNRTTSRYVREDEVQ